MDYLVPAIFLTVLIRNRHNRFLGIFENLQRKEHVLSRYEQKKSK
jgi:hypothetical protein